MALLPARDPNSANITWHTGLVSRADRQNLLKQKGVTLWFTGLSGSGKSTIACLVEKKLLDRQKLAYRLDGDNIRHGLNSNLGFSAEDRRENIRRIGQVTKLFTDAGIICLASFISPYRVDRLAVRSLHEPEDFVEIHVQVSLAEAERRDPKGLYRKARAGQLQNFTGVDDPYEPPEHPEIRLETEHLSAEALADSVIDYLQSQGYFRT